MARVSAQHDLYLKFTTNLVIKVKMSFFFFFFFDWTAHTAKNNSLESQDGQFTLDYITIDTQ